MFPSFIQIYSEPVFLQTHIDDADIRVRHAHNTIYIRDDATGSACALATCRNWCKQLIYPTLIYGVYDFDFNKYNLIVKLERIADEDGNSYSLVYYLRCTILDDLVNRKRVVKSDLIVDLLAREHQRILINNITSSLAQVLEPPKILPTTLDFCCFLKHSVQLFPHQLADIQWMEGISRRIETRDNIIKYQHKPFFQVFGHHDKNSYVNIIRNGSAHISPLAEHFAEEKTLQFFGGNIVSEVGLGKTLTCLAFMLYKGMKRRELYSKHVANAPDCSYMLKRGHKRGSFCNKAVLPTHGLHCQEHATRSFVEKRKLICDLTNFNMPDFIDNSSNTIITNASLVLCPNQLCSQWIKECYSKFKDDVRVVLIATRDHYENLTVGDILFADVIIVSYQFFSSPYYRNFNYVPYSNNEVNLDDAMRPLRHFRFNGVYLDEVHEIDNMISRFRETSQVHNRLKQLSSNSVWNITGTPFANGLTGFKRLISHNTDYLKHPINSSMIDSLQPLFRRNTKESVKDKIKHNIVTEHVNLLVFTPQERAIYDSYLNGNGNKYIPILLKLCCHADLHEDTKTLIQNCKTLSHIQTVLLDYNHKKMSSLGITISLIQNEIKKLENQITDSGAVDNKLLRIALSSAKQKLTIKSKEHASISNTYNYLKTAIESLSTANHECPICMEEIEGESLVLTKCGHKFCWDCIRSTHDATTMFKCPICNTALKNEDVFSIVEQQEEYTSDVNSLVESVKSTKIGNIIHYLQTGLEPNDKVIIFSQWDELLHKVGNALDKHSLRPVYCSGNVFARNKAVERFSNESSVNIILLSSRNAASGINLTAANKIILLEPVYGTHKYRKSIEDQAIGRSDRIGQQRSIQVIRFIIKDTIEQDILDHNIDDTKLQAMN